jgi:hypothetical protein
MAAAGRHLILLTGPDFRGYRRVPRKSGFLYRLKLFYKTLKCEVRAFLLFYKNVPVRILLPTTERRRSKNGTDMKRFRGFLGTLFCVPVLA